ncbi:hypothetical protein HKD37_02G004558 [Glycine soja]
MEESPKKRKGSSSTAAAAAHRRHGPSEAPTAPIHPSLSSPRSSTMFSSDDQRLWYLSQFSSRIILDPKILLPWSSNLAQASEEDLILMWAFLTGHQIDWAHLVRYRMHKALQANGPLPYPQLVTLFLRHFQIPLDYEPFRSFAIGAGAVTSFGYCKDRNGPWLKKDALPPQDERTPSPPPQRDDSALMNEVLSELRGLRTYVGERFDLLDNHFAGMDIHLTQLEEDVGYIRQSFDLPPPPPPS